jgi:hypothetical protein
MRYFATRNGPAIGPVTVLCVGHTHDTADGARSCGPHVWGQEDACAAVYAGKGYVGAVMVRRVPALLQEAPPSPPPSRPGARAACQDARERLDAADVALRSARLRAARPSEATRLAPEIARLTAERDSIRIELRAAEDEWLGSAEYQAQRLRKLHERASKVTSLPLEV